MREMVLNHASIVAFNKHEIFDWLDDIATGIAKLRSNCIVSDVLRTARQFHEISCLPNLTLQQALHELTKQPTSRDRSIFLLRLATYSPLIENLDFELIDRFHSVESEVPHIDAKDGEPLVLCAITNSVSLGFPSNGWDSSTLTVQFQELLDNGEFSSTEEVIDNIARTTHAIVLVHRHTQYNLSGIENWKDFWDKRSSVYPDLMFGKDVESQLDQIPPDLLETVAEKVWKINESAQKWKLEKTKEPIWSTKVTPERRELMKNKKLRNARIFKSSDDKFKLYEWHARYGNNGRIHLRFDRSSWSIEIGYIGRHLPS